MSTLPQRNTGVFITLGLAVVGAVVAAFILFSSSKATDVDLTTARLVPADASLYFALNTDLSSDQWVATFKLIERLGQENPQQELEDGADEVGVDWEKSVVPFLGGDAAVFLRSARVDFTDIDGGLVIKCNDPEAALNAIRDQSGFDIDEDEYEGHTYYFTDAGFYAVVIEDHLAITSNEDILFDIIDTADGRLENLTSVQDFKTLRDELSKNFLAFYYLDTGDLMADFLEADGGIMQSALEEAGIADIALKPSAFAVGAKTNSFEVQSASLGEPGAIGPATTPAESKFAKLVPGESAIFFSTHGLAQMYEQIRNDAGDEIDDAIAENSEYRDLDDALQAAGEEAGLESLDEILVRLTGESAFAAWFPHDTTDEAEGVFIADVKDEGETRDILARIIAEGATGTPAKSTVNGVEVTTALDEDGEPLAFAIKDGYVVIGTPDGVAAVLQPNGPRLAEMKNYKDTVEAMPTKLGTYGYFDLSLLLRLPEAGIVPDLDEVERALQGVIINYVNERDVVRTSGVVTIAE